MPECSNCGSHVSPAFFRVYSVDGEVDFCMVCTNWAERFSRY